MTDKQEIGSWTNELASKAPVPGGGAASALSGALAAALGQMVANLTTGKKRYAVWETEVQTALAQLAALQADFLSLADEDAEAFAPLAAAYALPSGTPAQKAEKARVMEENLLAASLVPLEIMRRADETLSILAVLAEKGSRMALSDVGVAAQLARTALLGAVMNVWINIKSMQDRQKAEELAGQAQELIAAGTAKADAIYAQVEKGLRGQN